MSDGKIIKLNTEKREEKAEKETFCNKQDFLHTNPILKKMFAANVLSDNDNKKFKLSDLFK